MSTSTREVLAMVSSRKYGLNLDNYETMLPQTHSLVGNGAAVESGYGIKKDKMHPVRQPAFCACNFS